MQNKFREEIKKINKIYNLKLGMAKIKVGN